MHNRSRSALVGIQSLKSIWVIKMIGRASAVRYLTAAGEAKHINLVIGDSAVRTDVLLSSTYAASERT